MGNAKTLCDASDPTCRRIEVRVDDLRRELPQYPPRKWPMEKTRRPARDDIKLDAARRLVTRNTGVGGVDFSTESAGAARTAILDEHTHAMPGTGLRGRKLHAIALASKEIRA
jgi:hypothetical protein